MPLSFAIVTLLFIESIFAWRYDLRPCGYLMFQGLKLILWTIVTVSSTIAFIVVSIQVVGAGCIFTPMVVLLFIVLYGALFPYSRHRDEINGNADLLTDLGSSSLVVSCMHTSAIPKTHKLVTNLKRRRCLLETKKITRRGDRKYGCRCTTRTVVSRHARGEMTMEI